MHCSFDGKSLVQRNIVLIESSKMEFDVRNQNIILSAIYFFFESQIPCVMSFHSSYLTFCSFVHLTGDCLKGKKNPFYSPRITVPE